MNRWSRRLGVIRASQALADMKPDLEALQASLREDTPEVFLEKLGPVRSAFSDIPGASDIRSAVNDARKAMRRDPDPAAAAAALQEAGRLLEEGIAWRERAQQQVLPQLETYEAAIRDTIGLRGQPRLPREQALYVAECSSHHRDVSLSF